MRGRRSTPETFWSYVSNVGQPDTCWMWEGYASETRGGDLKYQGKRYTAPRLAYYLTFGDKLDKNDYVSHKCGVQLCCNPDHLTVEVRLKKNTPEAFWRRVKKGEPSECWEWQGYTTELRYGQVAYEGSYWGVHRLAWYLTFGDIPQDMFICHMCDNPPCCNPSHLFVGTAEDNNHDMIGKGRMVVAVGEERNHKLTEQEVIAIRAEYATGRISQRKLGAKYNVSGRNICTIVNGDGWKHLL